MNKVIERLSAIIEENLDTHGGNQRGIKTIFKGDTDQIPTNSFPLIMISPDDTNILPVDSCDSTKTHNINVIVMLDERSYMNASGSTETAKFELSKIMEEEELVNGQFVRKTDTILYCVEQLLDELNYSTGKVDEIPIVYGETGDEATMPTKVALLTFSIERVPYQRN